MREACDPFVPSALHSPCLLNIATGKAASKETETYLNETFVDGHRRHVRFRDECAVDNDRFMKPIQRRPVSNFAKENAKKRCPNAKGKPNESIRDIFIRILIAISQKTNFNLKHVMAFPIIDFPLSLTHSHGSRITTDKNKLLKKFEKFQEGFTERPHLPIHVTLIDGGLLLHSHLRAIGNITTYGNLARSLLTSVCGNQGNEIHVLFDTYYRMSLKASERRLRGAEDCPFVISSPHQSPRQNCQKLLQNGMFKDQLAGFLLKEWQKCHYGPIIGTKPLVLSPGGDCIRLEFNQRESKMNVERPGHLQGIHEEADTLIAFHLSSVKGNVIIRASDTDVMVIIIGMLGRDINSQKPTLYERIIMECCLGTLIDTLISVSSPLR